MNCFSLSLALLHIVPGLLLLYSCLCYTRVPFVSLYKSCPNVHGDIIADTIFVRDILYSSDWVWSVCLLMHTLCVCVCVLFRSFITVRGALTHACHVTATRWVPFHVHVTQRQASASAGPGWSVASATHVTTPSLRSQIQAAKVRMFICFQTFW